MRMPKIDMFYFGKNGSFREESPNVFYTLGALYGKFSVLRYKKKPGFKFTSSNPELIEILKEELKITTKTSKHQTRESYYVRVHGVPELIERLDEIGIGTGKKQFPEIRSEFLPDFARGYFDAKLNIYTITHHKLKKPQEDFYLRLRDKEDFLRALFYAIGLNEVAERVGNAHNLAIYNRAAIFQLINFIYAPIDKPYPVIRGSKKVFTRERRLYLPQKRAKLEEIAEEYFPYPTQQPESYE